MANSVETYSARNVDVIYAGNILTGFTDDMIEVERVSGNFDDEVGAQGDVVRWALNDMRGVIRIYLQQTSSSNLILSAIEKLDRLSGAGINPCIIRDSGGKDVHLAPETWIVSVPAAKYKKAPDVRVWELRTSNLDQIIGGN